MALSIVIFSHASNHYPLSHASNHIEWCGIQQGSHHPHFGINSGAPCFLLSNKGEPLRLLTAKRRGRKRDMGGRKASSFLCLCFKFPGRSRYRDEVDDWDPGYTRKIRPSDEDRGRWVGEPDVDKKASEFIARFYQSRTTVA